MCNKKKRFGLISLFNGLSIFVGYLMPKQSLKKNSSGIVQIMVVEIKGFHTFLKGISLKVNAICNSVTR